jgi:dCMP deaminase
MKINYENRKPIIRPSWDQYFLNIAEVIATRSYDAETQVGSVIVDENNRIISSGYNSFPPNSSDADLPNLRPDKYPFFIHAEISSIASCKHDLRGATLYVTHSPCRECIKAIITAGIKRVVCRHKYDNDDFEFIIQFLTQCGVELEVQSGVCQVL